MSNLAVKTDEPAVSNLPVKTDNVLLLPYVGLVEKEELFETVTAAVAKCYADLNKDLPPVADLSYTINELTKIIRKTYPSIRLPEIPVAFARGIRGAYGKFYHNLSVVVFEGFIESHLDSNERMQLVHEKGKLLLEEKTEPTRDEKFNVAGRLVIDLFEYYKKNKVLNRSASAVYEFTKLLQLIDQVSRKGVYKEALAELVKEKTHSLLFAVNPFKRNVIESELNALRKNIEMDMITMEQHEEIIRTGKRFILRLWFDELIANNTNIIDLLESKRSFYTHLKKEETND